MPQLCCAQTYSYFPVETDHPPPTILRENHGWGRTRLFFQRTFDPTFLLTRPYAMTFVLAFLSARDCYQEFQLSIAIVHLEWHNCQSLLTLCRGNVGDFLAREQQSAG